MEIPSNVEKLKEAVLKRQQLVVERNALRTRINAGCDFFSQQADDPSVKEILKGAKLMAEYTAKLKELDSQIFELDTITICRLEEELLDSIIKLRTKESENEAGDSLKASDFYCVPKCYKKEDMVTVDADDLFFLKIIKSAFSIQNIEIVKKE